MSERLFARCVQKDDFVLDALAVQIQLKIEPRILRDLAGSIFEFPQLND
jgi:hypothetical protein